MANFSFDLLEGPYLADILDQPRATAATVEGLVPHPGLDALGRGLKNGHWRRIVLTGMGGSHAILEPLHIDLVRAGFECVTVETSEILYSMPALLGAETALLVVSQSGASAEIVRLFERRRGAFVAGVTNTPGSPLDQCADLVIRTRAGEEATVSTKTAVSSMAALHWIGASLSGADLPAAHRDLETLAPAIGEYLACWRAHVEDLAARLSGVRHVFVAGRGRSLAAAMLGGMMHKEAAHVHGEGMGCAALRHGPFEMLGPDVFVLVFEGDPEVSAMNRGLVNDVLATGAGAALCGTCGEGPFRLPDTPEALRPIVELLPPQMMTLAMAGLKGRRPGEFERIEKVTRVE